MFIHSALLFNRGLYLKSSHNKKTFNLGDNTYKDIFISNNSCKISFMRELSSLEWPISDKANLRIPEKKYTELLKILEEGIELIKNKNYKKAIEVLTDENNAKKTGIKMILLKDEYEKPPANMEETQLLYQASSICLVNQKKWPLELNLGHFLIKNEPKTADEKSF